MSEKKVWFITGCSTGFGRELAKQLLENLKDEFDTWAETSEEADFPETETAQA